MQDSEVIDPIPRNFRVTLVSKISIRVVCLLISPLLGSFLYSINLYKTNQKDKIFGIIFTSILFSWLITFGMMGFDINNNLYSLLYSTDNLVVGLTLIFPFWKIHFKPIKHREYFPWIIVALCFICYFLFIFYHIWLDKMYSFNNPPPYYLIEFTGYIDLVIAVIILPLKVILDILLTLRKKLKSHDSKI